MRHRAFTMMELIFVIVIIGIIAKFGVEFLIRAYDQYIFSSVQNRLQTQTEVALEQISNRLQYRIKPSVIARDASGFRALANANGDETILEWIGYDIDGLRGTTTPTWSGFIDLNNINSTKDHLVSLGTNTIDANSTIAALSNGAAGIANSAIFFIGGNSKVDGFGWGGAITSNSAAMHPLDFDATHQDYLQPHANLTGVDAYEYYQLAWTAYALVWSGGNKNHATYPTSLDDNVSSNLFTNAISGGVSAGTQNTQWSRNGTQHQYNVNVNNVNVTFTYNPTSGSFTCNTADATTGQICKRLTN